MKYSLLPIINTDNLELIKHRKYSRISNFSLQYYKKLQTTAQANSVTAPTIATSSSSKKKKIETIATICATLSLQYLD